MKHFEKLVEFTRERAKHLYITTRAISIPRDFDDLAAGSEMKTAFDVSLILRDGQAFSCREHFVDLDYAARDILDQIREQAKGTLVALAGEKS